MKAILIAAYFVTAQVQIISEPTREPTPAAICQCQSGGECLCGDNCDCAPKQTKPIITVVRKPRIDEFSPITLAPDPDYDAIEAEIERENSIPRKRGPSNEPFVSNFRRDEDAFVERWKNPNLKTWTGTTLPPEPSPAAVGAKATAPPITQPPATYKPVPIERAAMTYQCVNGVCQWVPASAAPTKRAQPQTYQRSRFRIFRRR
jgi:hypothetical protein